MSAGRKSASLADLQGIADDGFATAVRRMLLGEDAPAGEIEPVFHKRPDALLAADLDWQAFGRPADWAHRTTREDMRRLVADVAKRRLAESDWPIVDVLMFGKRRNVNAIAREDALRVARMCREIYKDELREVPSRPARARKVVKRETVMTHTGENSHVVRRLANGAVVVNGVLVDEDEARTTLRTIGCQ